MAIMGINYYIFPILRINIERGIKYGSYGTYDKLGKNTNLD